MILLVLNTGLTTAFAAMRETVSVTTLHAAVDVDAVADTLLAHSDGIDLAMENLPQASAEQDNADLQARLLQSLEGRRLVAQVKVDDSAALLVTASVDGALPQDASVQPANVVTVQNEQGETLRTDGTWTKEAQPTDAAVQPVTEQSTLREEVAKAITGITVIGYNVNEGVQYAYNMRLTGSVLRICKGTLTGYALEVREPEPAPIVPEEPIKPAPEVVKPETPAQPEPAPETKPETEVTEPQVPTTDAPKTEISPDTPKDEETTEKPVEPTTPSAPSEPTAMPEAPTAPTEQPAAPAGNSTTGQSPDTSAAPAAEDTVSAPVSDGLAASYTFGPRTVLKAQDGSAARTEEPVAASAAQTQPVSETAPVVTPEIPVTTPEMPAETPETAIDSTIRGWVVDPDAQPLDKGALKALLGYDPQDSKPVSDLAAWWVGDSYLFTVASCGVSELDLTVGTPNDKGELLPVVQQFATLTVDNNLADSTYAGVAFPFRVMLNDAPYTGEARLQTVAADGTATENGIVTFSAEGVVELKPGQRALIEKIATGTTYTVESLAVEVRSDTVTTQPVAGQPATTGEAVIGNAKTPLADTPQADAAAPEKQTIQLKLEIVAKTGNSAAAPTETAPVSADKPAPSETPAASVDSTSHTSATVAAVPVTGTYVFGPRAVMAGSDDSANAASVSGVLVASAIVQANIALSGWTNYLTIGQTTDESITYTLYGNDYDREYSIGNTTVTKAGDGNTGKIYFADYASESTVYSLKAQRSGESEITLGTYSLQYMWNVDERGGYYLVNKMSFTSVASIDWTLKQGGDGTDAPTLLVMPPKQHFIVKSVGAEVTYTLKNGNMLITNATIEDAQSREPIQQANGSFTLKVGQVAKISMDTVSGLSVIAAGNPYRVLVDNHIATNPATATHGNTIVFVYATLNASDNSTLNLSKQSIQQAPGTGLYQIELKVNGQESIGIGKADIVVVLDISTSMGSYLNETETRWSVVSKAVQNMAEQLLGRREQTDVRMAVAAYSGQPYAKNTLWNSSGIIKTWETHADAITESVKNIAIDGTYGGNTNCEAGFVQANELLKQVRDDAHKYVLYLSDGEANRSINDQDPVTDAIQAAKKINETYPDVSIITLGISSEPGTSVLNPEGNNKYNDAYAQAITSEQVYNCFQMVTNAIIKKYPQPTVIDKMGANVDFVKFANGNATTMTTTSSKFRSGNATYDGISRSITWDLDSSNGENDKLSDQSETFYLCYYVKVQDIYRVTDESAYTDTAGTNTGTHAGGRGWYTNEKAGIGFGGNTTLDTVSSLFPLPVARWSRATPVTLQVTKIDSINAATKLAGAQFKLIPAIPTTQDDWGVPPDAATINAAAVAFTTSTNGMGAKQLAETGNYWLYETTAPSGYDLPADPWKVAVTEASGTLHIAVTTVNGTVVQTIHSGDTFAVTLKNVKTPPKVASLEITKLGEGQHTLDGVIFRMTDAKGTSTDKTTANGKVTFSDLAVGTYTLQETKTVAGYMLPTKSWTVTVAQDANHQTIISINNGLTATLSNDTTRLYTTNIRNYKALTLPAAGGPGTAGFTAAGILLLVGCVPWVKKRETPLEVLLKGVVKR